jgi:hypothetical protein
MIGRSEGFFSVSRFYMRPDDLYYYNVQSPGTTTDIFPISPFCDNFTISVLDSNLRVEISWYDSNDDLKGTTISV